MKLLIVPCFQIAFPDELRFVLIAYQSVPVIAAIDPLHPFDGYIHNNSISPR
ncbi:hypothetical protein ACLBWT_01860 [Paenibacillus sp. D51F]